MIQSESKQTPILKAVGIGRLANDGQWLLRNVSIHVKPRDRIAVVGPSGSGKSVLLRSLVLLDPLEEGRISWNGNPISRDLITSFRSKVVYVHQQPQLFEGSVEQNLRMPFDLRIHANKSFELNQVTDLLKSVGRDETFLAKEHANLSGGEAAIVALIRAVQLNPDVLLLDEPTAALDEATMLQMEKLVDVWFQSAENRGMIWVSHNEAQVARISNRILQIENGSLRN